MANPRATVGMLTVLVACAAPARAQSTPEPSDADLDARLAWLDRVLDREGFATRVWRGTWIGFYSGGTALETLLAVLNNTPAKLGARIDSGVNVAKAALGLGFTLFSPADAGPRADNLRAMPTSTRAQRLAKLRYAEASLQAIASEERSRRGWFGLIGGALVNAGGAWVDWAAIKGNGTLGWITLTSGLAVAQIQFHTQPTGAIRAWDAYRRAGAGASLGDPPAVLRWSIGPTAGGAALRATF